MKCLISGGCGFIGSHLVDRLAEDHEVIVIDNLSAETNDQFYFNDKAKYYHDDICDYGKIEELFRGVDVVFHLAAKSRIQLSISAPFLTAQTNFNGTLNVLEASKVHKVKRVIFSSTSAAYGLKNNPPQKEDMEPDCLNLYSASKVGAENLCKAYTNLYNLETVVFRYFNVYGPREPKKGPYAPVIGLFQRQFENREMLTIVGDGLQTRDFTHVSDVVEANILAMDITNNRPVGEVINIGTGESSTIVGIADAIDTRSEQIYEYLPPRPGEARHTRASISKAKRLLRWKPKVKLKSYLQGL